MLNAEIDPLDDQVMFEFVCFNFFELESSVSPGEKINKKEILPITTDLVKLTVSRIGMSYNE